MSASTANVPAAGTAGWPRLAYGALLAFAGYYAGSKLGLALTFGPNPIAILWPANAVLMAALVLAPARAWPVLVLAVLPAHLLAQLQGGVPPPMVLCWYVSNMAEALIGAACLRRVLDGPPRFERGRDVAAFAVCGVALAPFLSTFLDVGFVLLNDWGLGGYWPLWRARFFSNALAALIVVPPIVTFASRGAGALAAAPPSRVLEAVLLACGVLLVGILAFGFEPSNTIAPVASLYLPLPFLLWAALRFGTAGASAAFAVVALVAAWGAGHGRGPFTDGMPEDNALEIQLFLTFAGLTTLAFAALMQERRSAERILQSSEERFATAFHASPDAMAISRKSDGRFIEVNERWLELFGHARGEVIGRTLRETGILAEDGVREKLAVLDAEQGGVHELDLALRTARGEVIHGFVTTRAMDMEGERRFVTVIRDDTVRSRAHAALRESEARFRSLADSVPVMIWMSGPDKLGTFFSKGWLEFSGRALEDELGYGWTQGVHPDDLERCLSAYCGAFDTMGRFEIEYRRRRHDGSYRWVAGSGVPRIAPDGTFLGYIGTCTDITERRDSERMLALALEVLPVAVLIVDAHGRIALANAHVEKLFGYRAKDLIGASIDVLVSEGTGNGYSAARDGIFAMPQAQAAAASGERRARRKDGTELLIEVGLNPMESRDALLFLAVISDVTEHYELQRSREELTHMTRISVMGELAASLAHELNQPLAAILANAQAAQRFMALESIDLDEVRSILEDIVKDDSRASEVIRRMRALAAKGELEIVLLDLSELIRDVAVLLHSDAIVRGVRLTLEVEPGLTVNGDRVQLQQVMLNLLLNAFDAVKECATRSRAVTVQATGAGRGTVSVAVIDQGVGLSGDKLDKIFTPFFTSKREGLGLGLAISRSIVEAHGGRLRAANNPVRGATFHFTLPAAAAAAQEA